jgi:hypothetical protein
MLEQKGCTKIDNARSGRLPTMLSRVYSVLCAQSSMQVVFFSTAVKLMEQIFISFMFIKIW